jgi:tetratricopeptide (TPR) repeat protein
MSKTIRVGVVQVFSLPAYAGPGTNGLSEPAPPVAEDHQGRFILAGLRAMQGVQALRKACQLAHVNDLREKLGAGFRAARSLSCDLLVLPEYSVPIELLPMVAQAARGANCCIVAGTHTVRVTPETTPLYLQVGLEELTKDPAGNNGCAVAPVFVGGERTLAVFKSYQSKWEPDLQTRPPSDKAIDVVARGVSFKFELKICLDALREQAFLPDAELLAVTASSPATAPFVDLFSYARMREVPSAIANSAGYGESQIATAAASAESSLMALRKFGPGEEGLLVLEIDLDNQFQKHGSAITATPATVIGCLPFLYASARAHAGVIEWHEEVAAKRTAIVPEHARQLAKIRALPPTMKTKLELLADGLAEGALTARQSELLFQMISLPRGVVPFANRCAQLLDASATTVTELLRNDPSNERIMTTMKRVATALRTWRHHCIELLSSPPAVLEEVVQARAPFVDREDEQESLRKALRQGGPVVLEGLPGMGKRSLLARVLAEALPNSNEEYVDCVPTTDDARLLDELGEKLQIDPDEFIATPAAHATVERVVVVTNGEYPLLGVDQASRLMVFLRALMATRIRVVILSVRQLDLPFPRLHVGRLKDRDLARVLDFWTRSFGVEQDGSVLRRLYGYPLAAKLYAQLVRDGAGEAMHRLAFITELRKEIIRVILRDFTIGDAEKRVIAALSIFRIPVPTTFLETLEPDAASAALDQLEERFLIERYARGVILNPIVAEVAVEEWLSGSGVAYHRAAAGYYEAQLKDEEAVNRLRARSEAIYHYTSARDFGAARRLGQDWHREARGAAGDLYQRREFEACLAICEEALISKPSAEEFLGRAALCSMRLHRRDQAMDYLSRLRSMGPVPASILNGLGESLVAQGLVTEGVLLLTESHEQYPGDAYVCAALAEAALSQGDVERARDFAAEALEKNAKLFRALDIASRIARRLGNIDEAYRLSRRAMGINPVRGEQNYKKALSGVRRKYDGQIPDFLQDE